MTNEDRNRTTSTNNRFRAYLNISMGIIYIIFGIAIMYIKYFGSIALGTMAAYTLGGIMLLYGAFRMWRGIVDIRQKP